MADWTRSGGGVSGRPPHSATGARPRAPHPATVAQPMRAFGPGVAQRPPHAATVVERRSPIRSATAQRSRAQVKSALEMFAEDPGQFVAANHVIVGDIALGEADAASMGKITLKTPGIAKVTLRKNNNVCSLLRDDDNGSPAYLLPWAQDDIVGIKLGNEAKYFFTAQLSGCKIFIQGPAKYGVIVYHANAFSAPSVQLGDAAMNKLFETRRLRPTPAMKTMSRAQYGWKTPAEQRDLFPGKTMAGQVVSFFGLLNGSAWRFFYQSVHVALDESYDEVFLGEHRLAGELNYL